MAWRNGSISEDDFNNALDVIIHYSGERLRELSSDRAAIALASYKLSLENGHTSQSFPFLTALDGMVALLADVKTVDYYEIKLNRKIPATATHLIVYNRRCRLPENVCVKREYFGDINLPNGSYELHRDLKSGVSLIVPRVVRKDRLNKFAAEFHDKKKQLNFTVTGIVMDAAKPGMAFSLTPFCEKIYRLSEMSCNEAASGVIIGIG